MITHASRWGAAFSAAIVLSLGTLISPASAFGQHARKLQHAQGMPAAKTVRYAQVAPIFAANCVKCHHGPKAPAKLHLDSYAGIMKGNDHGQGVKPGNPKGSLISQLVHSTGKKHMPPPPNTALTAAQMATIDAWIKAGAKK